MKVGSRGAVDAYARTSAVRVNPPRPTSSSDGTASSGGTGAAAEVSISPEARALVAGAAPPVDHAKVDGLRAKLADGTFKVDAHAIAAKLVDKMA